MFASRTLGSLLVMLMAAGAGWAQTYSLAETSQPGECFHVRVELTLTGEMRIQRDNGIVPLKHELSAQHDFSERLLNIGANGLPNKSARVYEIAKSVILVNQARSEHAFRQGRRLFVAQQHKDHSLIYCPTGPLTREELDVAQHFDTLSIAGLLPGREVAVGATWQVANPVVQALCSFEGLTEQKLVCKLEEVRDETARVSVSGPATGIDLGALVKLNLSATCYFDVVKRRLTRLEWKQKEERDQGPASPAATVQSTTVLTRAPIEQPETLSDVALVSVPDGFEPKPPLNYLEHSDTKNRFKMLYEREWQTVSQNEEHVVMRLMDQGDFVAQVTITPWTKADKDKHLSAEEFSKAMAETPGWEQEQELQTGEVPSDGGRWIYRISATGQLDGNKAMQNFYLIAGPGGDQVVLAFTMTPKQADRLGTRDLSLAASVEFPNK